MQDVSQERTVKSVSIPESVRNIASVQCDRGQEPSQKIRFIFKIYF